MKSGSATIWCCRFLYDLSKLEFDGKSYVDLSASQIIWHSVLNIIYIGYPIVAADIRNIEKIETIEPEPNALQIAEETVSRFIVI